MKCWMNKQYPLREQTFNSQAVIHCPNLIEKVQSLLESASPGDIGTILSRIHKSVVLLAVFLVQRPNMNQTVEYCDRLHQFANSTSPIVDWDSVHIREIAAFLLMRINNMRQTYPEFAAIEAGLLPLNTEEAQDRAYAWHRALVTLFFEAIMAKLRPDLHRRFTFIQYFGVARAFGHEMIRPGTMPDPEISGLAYEGPLVEMLVFPEDPYVPCGEPIALHQFCQPATKIPDETTCSICASDVVAKHADQIDDEEPVVTQCGHHYHKGCLNEWVNESAMSNSNQCPACRAELCAPRQRAPMSYVGQLPSLEEVLEAQEAN